jgi:hypothetical protein
LGADIKNDSNYYTAVHHHHQPINVSIDQP